MCFGDTLWCCQARLDIETPHVSRWERSKVNFRCPGRIPLCLRVCTCLDISRSSWHGTVTFCAVSTPLRNPWGICKPLSFRTLKICHLTPHSAIGRLFDLCFTPDVWKVLLELFFSVLPGIILRVLLLLPHQLSTVSANESRNQTKTSVSCIPIPEEEICSYWFSNDDPVRSLLEVSRIILTSNAAWSKCPLPMGLW